MAMNKFELHKLIIKKLKEAYGDLENLKTNNDNLNTKIFLSVEDYEGLDSFNLTDEELPLLECRLLNGNKVLATTKSLYSYYNGNRYKMSFSEFENNDRRYFSKSSQIAEGMTRTFNYLLKDGSNFMYEIDSFYPADLVHNKLVLSMQFNKYNIT